MSRIPVTLKIEMGLDAEGVLALTRALNDANFGTHVLNTIVNHAHIDAAALRKVEIEVDPSALVNA